MKKIIIVLAVIAALYWYFIGRYAKKGDQVGRNYASTFGPQWKEILAGEISNVAGEFYINGKWQTPWVKDPVTDVKTPLPGYEFVNKKWQKIK